MSISNSSSRAASGGSSTSKTGFLRREDIVGKPVVGQDAMIVGAVKDLAVSVEGKVALQVEKKDTNPENGSSDVLISSDEILAVGDFVLLKSPKTNSGQNTSKVASLSPQSENAAPPPFPGNVSSDVCPRCSFANSHTSRFCVKCGSLLR